LSAGTWISPKASLSVLISAILDAVAWSFLEKRGWDIYLKDLAVEVLKYDPCGEDEEFEENVEEESRELGVAERHV
jgi:hypothetical protein